MNDDKSYLTWCDFEVSEYFLERIESHINTCMWGAVAQGTERVTLWLEDQGFDPDLMRSACHWCVNERLMILHDTAICQRFWRVSRKTQSTVQAHLPWSKKTVKSKLNQWSQFTNLVFSYLMETSAMGSVCDTYSSPYGGSVVWFWTYSQWFSGIWRYERKGHIGTYHIWSWWLCWK